jgi:hypothetical protein
VRYSRKLDVVKGSHRFLELGPMGAVMGVVRKNEKIIDDLGSAGSDHHRTWLFLERVGLAEVSKWEDLYLAFHSPASIKGLFSLRDTITPSKQIIYLGNIHEKPRRSAEMALRIRCYISVSEEGLSKWMDGALQKPTLMY